MAPDVLFSSQASWLAVTSVSELHQMWTKHRKRLDGLEEER